MAKKKKKKAKKNNRFILFFAILAIVALLVTFGTKYGGGSIMRIVYLIGTGITGVAEESAISFDEASANRFHAVSGGFAVLSADGMHIYDLSGKEKSYFMLSYHSPSITGSKNSVIAYDRNGQEYTVLNKNKILYNGKTNAPIINLTMNSNSSYSVVTAGPECKALVTVYSSKFKELYKLYSTEQYILSAPISNNLKYMATLGFSAGSGQFNGMISFYKLDTEGAIATVSLPDCMPISASFMQNGNLSVLCEDRMLTYTEKGELVREILFDGFSVSKASLNSKNISSVLLNTNSLGGASRLIVSKGGDEPLIMNFSEDIFDISSAGNYTALLLANRIVVYNKNGEEHHTFPLAQSAKSCIMREDGTVFAVGANFANLLIP